MKNILVIGASSSIAKECCKIWALEKNNLFLVSRNKHELDKLVNDLKIINNNHYEKFLLDVNDFKKHDELIKTAIHKLDKIDIVLIAHGILSNQNQILNNTNEIIKEINTNGVSTICLIVELVKELKKNNGGVIATITSVAGDRGKSSNFIYGSSKSMVSCFLSGLRQKLFNTNIHVIDIKPAFINSKMTDNYKKNFLWKDPSDIAPQIVKEINKKKDIIYAPKYWKLISLIINLIPEFIFKRIKL